MMLLTREKFLMRKKTKICLEDVRGLIQTLLHTEMKGET